MFRYFFVSIFLIFYLNSGVIDIIKNFKPTADEIKSGAVIVKNLQVTKIEEKKASYYYLIAILNEKAALDYSHIEFPFNSYYLDGKLVFARVIDKNGNIKELKKDAVEIKNSPNSGGYSDTKIISFSLPSVKKGSFIEFKIEGKIKKNVIPNHFSTIAHLVYAHTNYRKKLIRIDSTREAIYKIYIPKERKLYFEQIGDVNRTVKEENRTTVYSWELKNFKNIKLEPAQLESSDKILPNIVISDMKNWKVLNDYFYKKYSAASTPSREIKLLTQKITKDYNTTKEKIVRIYNYIQNNIMYIFAHLGRGGMLPHKAEEILNNGYGDCKDQTTLLLAMLRSVGIKGYPALVSTQYNQRDYKIATDKYFDHIITYIPKENLWLDTVGYKGKFPGISWRIADSKAFVLNESGGVLNTIPDIDIQRVKANFEFNPKNNYIEGKLVYKLPSQLSNFIKSYLVNTQNAKDKLENQLMHILKADIISFELKNSENVDKNVEYIWHFRVGEGVKIDKYYFLGLMRNIFALNFPIINLKRPEERIWGFSYGFLFAIDVTSSINISKGFKYKIQLPQVWINPYLNYKININESNGTIRVSEHFEMKKRIIPKTEYKKFYESVGKIFNFTTWSIILTRKEGSLLDNMLVKAVNEEASEDNIIKLANYYIDKTEYNKAKEVLEKGVKGHPKSAKLHHLYGVVLGYMDMFDKSDKEMKIAKELGYKESL